MTDELVRGIFKLTFADVCRSFYVSPASTPVAGVGDGGGIS